MNKNELMRDISIRRACEKYGLECEEYKIYQDVIIVNTPKKDVFILLDENYNTIGIPKILKASPVRSIEEYAFFYNDLYEFTDESDGIAFPYPFQNYNLKQIYGLANRIHIHEVNQGHSSDMIINGEIINGENDEVYVSLLSYIKFIDEQIRHYFINLYQAQMKDLEYPSVYQYIRDIVNKINECIDLYIKKGIRPFPANIMEFLSQEENINSLNNHELYNIIDLLLKQKGYKKGTGFEHYKDLEKTTKDTTDLSLISRKLLKLLDISEDEVNKRYQESNETFIINKVDLHTWLENNDEKSPLLTKSKNN